MTDDESFAGFPSRTPAFLAELAINNDRAWFAEHRGEYQAFVQTPLRRLVTALTPAMLTIDPGFDVNPRGAAVSRIYRDTRFSRDKAPYRVNQWVSFKRPSSEWPSRPAYFVEIRPDGYRHGLGFYDAAPATMATLRATITDLLPRFLAADMAAKALGYMVEGECYKRPRLSQDLPVAAVDWCIRKNAYLVCNRPIEPIFFSGALVDTIGTCFVALKPMYRFLAEAIVPARRLQDNVQCRPGD